MQDRSKAIGKAALIALVGNGILAIVKIVAGFLAGSLAVVGDGIDSSTDVIIAAITLLASRITAKPSDREHPFGHGRAETLATTLLAFIIFFAGAQLCISTIEHFLQGRSRQIPGSLALYVSILSVGGKLFLAWTQFTFGKQYSSEMLKANGKNMLNDTLISSTVLAGVFFTIVLRKPFLDSLFAFLVSIWIMKSAVGIFLGVRTELMDGNTDSELYHAIFDAVRTVPGAGNPHRTRIRKVANLFDIDLDIEVDPALSVAEAHDIAVEVEREIRNRIDSVFDVMVHVEPLGNLEEGESFGLAESHFIDTKEERDS
ncbi:MAG: cation diffusion facilitator family transporter [Spirochaetales bacterium]